MNHIDIHKVNLLIQFQAYIYTFMLRVCVFVKFADAYAYTIIRMIYCSRTWTYKTRNALWVYEYGCFQK